MIASTMVRASAKGLPLRPVGRGSMSAIIDHWASESTWNLDIWPVSQDGRYILVRHALVGPSIPHYRRPQNTAISQVRRLDPTHHRTCPLSPTGLVASLRSHARQSTAPRSGDPDAASHPPRPSGAQTLQRL